MKSYATIATNIFIVMARNMMILATCLLSTLPLTAQHYTYLSGSLGNLTSSGPEVNAPIRIRDGGLLDGSTRNVSLRQQFGRYFSLGLEYSRCYFSPLLQIEERGPTSFGTMQSDRLSVKTNFDVRVYNDRISAYGSFAYIYSIEDQGMSATGLCNPSNLLVENRLLTGMDRVSFLAAGAGTRIRLMGELLVEMELGYATSFQEIYSYTIYYGDLDTNPYVCEMEEGMDHFYFRAGFAYPLQPVCRLLGKTVDFMLAL